MSPLSSDVIGVPGRDLRNFPSGRQIDVAVAGIRLRRRLSTALARLLTALAGGVALGGREPHRRRGRHGIDLAAEADVDRTQGLHQGVMVAAHWASASAAAATCALSAVEARSAASLCALRMREL